LVLAEGWGAVIPGNLVLATGLRAELVVALVKNQFSSLTASQRKHSTAGLVAVEAVVGRAAVVDRPEARAETGLIPFTTMAGLVGRAGTRRSTERDSLEIPVNPKAETEKMGWQRFTLIRLFKQKE
jgi:hypothetical protein